MKAREESPARVSSTAALFAALLAVSAWIAVPLGPVPATLQTLVLVLAALLLRPRTALAATLVYLLIGAVGVPAFSGMQGGLGILLGPTGGFLLGFPVGATLGAALRLRVRAFTEQVVGTAARARALGDASAALSVLGVVYLVGWAQLMLVTGMSSVEALAVGIVPFIALDAIKAFAAVTVAGALRRALGVRLSFA